MGYFYSFKLHLIFNEMGQILDFQITKANVDDRQTLKNGSILKRISGKLFGDKGYVSKELTNNLHAKGIQLITGIRKNMKNVLIKYTERSFKCVLLTLDYETKRSTFRACKRDVYKNERTLV